VDTHKILNRQNSHFCQLLNVQGGGGGVRQTEIHKPQSFVPEPSAFQVDMASGKLKC
jgi:hypothetical protein